MNIFATGREGFIARALLQRFQDVGYSLQTTTRDRALPGPFLELTQPEHFDYSLIQPGDVILHLAAISSPDLCQKEYSTAYQINVLGPQYFLKQCLKQGARIIFFSSDAVYGPSLSETSFDESSMCHPVGDYAKMKYEVEQTFGNEKQFKIFRLSYIFAKSDKFTSYLMTCSHQHRTAEIFDALSRNVVCLSDVLDATIRLATHFEKFTQNVFNICGPELLSRKDIADLYHDLVDSELKLKIVAPSDSFFQARPKTIRVQSLYLESLLGKKPFDLRSAMKKEFNL